MISVSQIRYSVEVRGYVSPMDIDLNLTPNGLYKGFEAELYNWSFIYGALATRWLCTWNLCTCRKDKCGFKLRTFHIAFKALVLRPDSTHFQIDSNWGCRCFPFGVLWRFLDWSRKPATQGQNDDVTTTAPLWKSCKEGLHWHCRSMERQKSAAFALSRAMTKLPTEERCAHALSAYCIPCSQHGQSQSNHANPFVVPAGWFH